MPLIEVPRNLSTADAVRIARELGCEVVVPRRTGEYLFIFPDGYRNRMNLRRKDASMAIVSKLRQLAKRLAEV